MQAATEVWPQLLESLTVVPGPPKVLEDLNYYTKSVLSHNKVIKLFLEANLKGLVVRGQQKGQIDAESGQVVSWTHGCLFIPAPHLNKVILIKSVSDLSKVDFIESTTNSIVDQLSKIQSEFSDFKTGGCKAGLQINLFILLPKSTKGKENLDALKSALIPQNLINDMTNDLTISIEYVNENNFAAKVSKLNSESSADSGTTMLLEMLTARYSKIEVRYVLTIETFRNLSHQNCAFHEIENVVYLYHFYFPDRKQKLEMIPNINRIFDNLLYKTTEDGKIMEMNEAGLYLGEVYHFVSKIIGKYSTSNGVLLKNFTNRHFNTLLGTDSLEALEFEIDWLYLGGEMMIAFEAGMSNKPEQPIQSVLNKLSQSVTKIYPQFLLILYSLWVEYQKINHSEVEFRNFEKFLADHFKIVVFLPNISHDGFKNCITTIKESSTVGKSSKKVKSCVPEGFASMLSKNSQCLQQTLFLLEDSDKLWQITDDLDVTESTDELQKLLRTESSGSNTEFNYISALLSLVRLNVVEMAKPALDVTERYHHSFTIWQKKKRKMDPVCQNFILSPEQHRILAEEDKTHLVVCGEPGTGKTALLLAKCEQMAQREEIDYVFYVFNQTKTLLINYLNSFMEFGATEILKKKMKILKFKRRPIEIEKKFDFEPSRSVLIVDEAYICYSECDLTRYKVCWIAIVEAGQTTTTYTYCDFSNFVPPIGFQVENLHISFRSAHHISELSHNFIKKKLQTYVTTTRVPGCFSSEQTQVKVRSIKSLDDSNLYDSSLLGSKFENRLIIIFSKNKQIGSKIGSIKSAWKATDVEISSDSRFTTTRQSYTGFEAQSVVIVIDVEEWKDYMLCAINLALSRAQYEVGLLVNEKISNRPEWIEYISGVIPNYVRTFERFLSKKALSSDWLQPNDLDLYEFYWWKSKFSPNCVSDVFDMNESLKVQPWKVCIQFASAFPDELKLRLTVKDGNVAAECELRTGNQETVGAHCIDNHFCFGLAKESLKAVSSSLENLNILYLAACSLNTDHFKQFVDLLTVSELLGTEIVKLYPNVGIATLLMMRTKEIHRSNRMLQNQLEIVEYLFQLGYPNHLLMTKINESNVFDYLFALDWDHKNLKLVKFILSDNERADLFVFGHLGINKNDDEHIRRQKYLTWQHSSQKTNEMILQKICSRYDFDFLLVQWAITFLGSFDYLLKIELSILSEGQSVLMKVIGSLNQLYYEIKTGSKMPTTYPEERKLVILKTARLILESGFPSELLLLDIKYFHRRDISFNVLDLAISANFVEAAELLLESEERRQIFFNSIKGHTYHEWFETNMNTTQS